MTGETFWLIVSMLSAALAWIYLLHKLRTGEPVSNTDYVLAVVVLGLALALLALSTIGRDVPRSNGAPRGRPSGVFFVKNGLF